jgi:hypothetical protein
MDNFPRQTLRRILTKHGKNICADARRCEALLNDLCGAYRREINVLVNAVEERVPLDLLAGAGSMPTGLLLTRLEKRLEDDTGLTAEAARWSVESWALALGIATDAEIEERSAAAKTPAPKAERVRPVESENKTTERQQQITNTDQTPPPKPQTPVSPPKSSPPSPSVNRPPIKIPTSSPPMRKPTGNLPVTQPSATNYPPPASAAPSSKNRIGIFRGCLIIVFLLALASLALFFGAPYAFEAMRETQRERNNEPPRFPAR